MSPMQKTMNPVSADASLSSVNTRERKVSFLEGEGELSHGEYLVPSTEVMTPNRKRELRSR